MPAIFITNIKISVFLWAVIGSFLPTLFWLWFWLQEDKKKPEPARLIAKTFIIGGFFIALAFGLEKLVSSDPLTIAKIQESLTQKIPLDGFFLINLPLILWAVIEELVKYLAAYVAAFKNRRFFDEPVDAMIYMVTAALGFAAVENFLFLLNTLSDSGGIGLTFLFTGNLRFIGATLLHVVTSAIFGAFLGLTFYQNRWWRSFSWLIGLVAATGLHALFNLFIITDGGENILGILFGLWVMAAIVVFLFEIVKRIYRPDSIINTQPLTTNQT